MAIRAKYTGDGREYLEGVPARDLEEEDYQALDSDQRAAVRGSDLYDTKTDAQMRPGTGDQSTRSAGGGSGGGN